MESFYGGKQGTPFVLVKSYSSIQAMKEDFDLGDAFEEVKYGEYVIINDPSNSEEHGTICRRIPNIGEEDPYEIIGVMTGPAGPQGAQGIQGARGETGPQGPQGVPGPTVPISSEFYSDIIQMPNYRNLLIWVDNRDLVPGTASTNGINYASAYDSNSGTYKVGFQWPYPVVVLNGAGVTATTIRPFYYEYTITQPVSAIAKTEAAITQADKESLSNGGLWFVVEDN